MEAGTLLRLLVIFLGFYHLACLNAVPTTRIGSFMHGIGRLQVDQLDLRNTHMEAMESKLEEEEIKGRMEMELNDYPGSGANNRHTPRSQFGRGCVDC